MLSARGRADPHSVGESDLARKNDAVSFQQANELSCKSIRSSATRSEKYLKNTIDPQLPGGRDEKLGGRLLGYVQKRSQPRSDRREVDQSQRTDKGEYVGRRAIGRIRLGWC